MRVIFAVIEQPLYKGAFFNLLLVEYFSRYPELKEVI